MNWQTPDSAELLAIGEVCDITGLSPRTVRYYEELGLLEGVRRRVGGRRAYGADDIERLRFIRRLKTLGLALAQIKELSAIYAIGGSTLTMLEKLEDLLCVRQSDLESRISDLMTLRDDMSKYRDHVETRIGSLRPVPRDGEKAS